MFGIRSSFIAGFTLFAVAALLPSHARADQRDELTYFTFTAPVQIPGADLPAGTYMFKLADPDGDRQVIRVLNQDGTKIYSTFMAVPTERMSVPDEPIVTFDEAPAGTPEPIRAFFYPGNRTGYEFVYPTADTSR
jgi:hypothetical protein